MRRCLVRRRELRLVLLNHAERGQREIHLGLDGAESGAVGVHLLPQQGHHLRELGERREERLLCSFDLRHHHTRLRTGTSRQRRTAARRNAQLKIRSGQLGRSLR